MLTIYCNECGGTFYCSAAYCCPHCNSVRVTVVDETAG